MAGQDDYPLDGAVRLSNGMTPCLDVLDQPTPKRPSLATTAGYRGMLDYGRGIPTDLSPDIDIWSMAAIWKLDSSWTDFEGDGTTVGEIMPRIRHKITLWEEYIYLTESMRIYGQQVPIRIFPRGLTPARLRDGINRIAIAELLGWDSMLVTTGIMEKSMWLDWDQSEQGKKFHSLKAGRMGFVK